MTTDLHATLSAALGIGSGRGYEAVEALVAAGEPGVELLAQRTESEVVHYRVWDAVIAGLLRSGRFSVLARYLDYPNSRVCAYVMGGLDHSGDPAAAAPLLDYLAADGPSRGLIRALGNVGRDDDERVVAALRECAVSVAGDLLEPGGTGRLSAEAIERARLRDLQDVANVAEALAKVGDMSLRPAVLQLVTFMGDGQSDYEVSRIRKLAVSALEVMVGPGVAEGLHQACRDPDEEIACSALAATSLIGRVEETQLWLSILCEEHRHAEPEETTCCAPNRLWAAVRCLEVVCGDSPFWDDEPPSAADVRHWWATQPGFARDVCYRGGRPATPEMLFPELDGRHSSSARYELGALLGLTWVAHLDFPVPARRRTELKNWWQHNSHRLRPGQLHRWGRSYPPDAVD